jgi:PAS domain S-box-containing protein
MGESDEQRSEVLARALLDSASEAMAALSSEGEVLCWNAAAEVLFGAQQGQASTRPIAERVPEGDRSALLRALEQARRGARVRLEASWPQASGRPLRVSMVLQPLAVPGAAGLLALHARASTDLPRSDRTPAAEFRLPLDSSPDAMVIVGGDGRILHANSQTARLFGWPLQELLGRQLEVLVPPRFREAHAGHRQQFFTDPRARGMGSGLELSGLRRDGSEFPIEVSLSPLRTPEGAVVVASAIRDVSSRRRTEAALQRANKELEAFSYSVAHDLRAPLRGMNGFAQVLLEEYSARLDPSGIDCLQEIQANAVRMGRLIDALLSLSRVTRSDCRPERLDLSALARSVAAQLQAGDPRQVEVVVQPQVEALLDPALGRTLLENLIGNAWKFTGATAGPRIEVGAQELKGERVFFVRDNGAGFDQEFAGKLFVPFQRLHPAGEFPGSGIGLATAQRIVHRHGGRIWGNGRVGAGACFSFTISDPPAGGPLGEVSWSGSKG